MFRPKLLPSFLAATFLVATFSSVARADERLEFEFDLDLTGIAFGSENSEADTNGSPPSSDESVEADEGCPSRSFVHIGTAPEPSPEDEEADGAEQPETAEGDSSDPEDVPETEECPEPVFLDPASMVSAAKEQGEEQVDETQEDVGALYALCSQIREELKRQGINRCEGVTFVPVRYDESYENGSRYNPTTGRSEPDIFPACVIMSGTKVVKYIKPSMLRNENLPKEIAEAIGTAVAEIEYGPDSECPGAFRDGERVTQDVRRTVASPSGP